jgi:hypothetical protein
MLTNLGDRRSTGSAMLAVGDADDFDVVNYDLKSLITSILLDEDQFIFL